MTQDDSDQPQVTRRRFSAAILGTGLFGFDLEMPTLSSSPDEIWVLETDQVGAYVDVTPEETPAIVVEPDGSAYIWNKRDKTWLTLSGGGGALSDSGTDNAGGGDNYQLPQAEDAIDLQSAGDILNAASVDTDVLSGADIQNASSGQVPKSQGDGTLAMGSAGGVGEASTAYLSSDQSISANTVTKVQLDTSEFDTDSGWDLTNHQYVVQTAGKYLVTGTLQYKSASSGASVRGFLYVNGASKARFRSKSHGGSPSRAVTRSFDLAANDTIDFRTEHTDSSSQSLEGLQRITYLNVVRVA